MTLEEIEKVIELAIMANGGEPIKKDTEYTINWCQCDPSVGNVPCEYCAIRDGLNKAKYLLSEVKRLREGVKRFKLKMDDYLRDQEIDPTLEELYELLKEN